MDQSQKLWGNKKKVNFVIDAKLLCFIKQQNPPPKKVMGFSFLVIRAGFEPTARSLEGCCSIQLSYRTITN